MKKSKGSKETSVSRGKFSGRIGYVLAVAGSAVGLGNIWRFPYLAAKYGGGMFLLVYFRPLAKLGKAVKIADASNQRKAKSETVSAVAIAFREDTKSFDKSDSVFNKDTLL